MTVGEFKHAIKDYPDTYQLVLSRDAEGNSFSPLAEINGCEYTEETTWCGSVDTEATAGDWNAAVLWPTN